jgi:dipeptidyl-peptidase-4
MYILFAIESAMMQTCGRIIGIGMVKGNSHRQLILALLSLTLAGMAGRLAAQNPLATKALIIERIAEERDRENSLPANLAWSTSGKSLSFVRRALRPGKAADRSLAVEIRSIDVATGGQTLLVSDSEISAAFGGYHPHGATGGREADGARQLQDYAWAPDGHALLLANSVALAWFSLDAHSSRLLLTNRTGLRNPQISPDGRFVSFLQDHTLWLADASTGAAHALSPPGTGDLREGEPDWVYLHELGMQLAYWWSPDSSSIAWIETDDRAVVKYSLRRSDGDEHSIAYPKPGEAIPAIRLFVQAVSSHKPLQIDLGNDANVYIPLVQWLPDGKHLAIERLSRNQKTLDLLLADSATGKARVILTENDAYWINVCKGLHFLKDSHRFLWSSENSGFRHLYLYDTFGRKPIQLTHGDWEVTSLVGADETTSTVYFTASESSTLERQLYRVNLDGTGLTRITREKGTHNPVMSPSGDLLLDTWSSQASPPSQDLLRADGSRIASLGGTAPDDPVTLQLNMQLNSIEFLTLKTHLGMDMNAWIMKPQDFDAARKYPVILYIAGGPGEQTVREAWGGDISLWLALMAQNGYIVFAVDHRGSAGRGHLFEEPLHLRLSAAEMADLRDEVLYLRSQPGIDKTRIGICGWGYGGFLTLHGMLDRPLLFKAGFAGSPITDWHLYDAVFAERYLEDPTRNQDGWLSSSPLENAKNLSAPLLLAQATLDESVHQENSWMLLDELLDRGKYADILLFPDRQDLFEDYGERLILFQRLTDFFLKNL